MSAKQPLWDVVIPLQIASRADADELARILTHDDDLPIVAVMCDVAPDAARPLRATITVSIGVRAPDNLTAIIRAAKFARGCCRQLGFGAHLTPQGITVGPSQLNTPPAPAGGETDGT